MATASKDWVNPKIQIRKTTDKGKGMFGDEKIVHRFNREIKGLRR